MTETTSTTSAHPLTKPQERALLALVVLTEGGEHSVAPRQVAKALWPDSVGWHRRTTMYGGRNGAVGGTMPMKAATMLWRLSGLGLATMAGASSDLSANLWLPTTKGLALTATLEGDS